MTEHFWGAVLGNQKLLSFRFKMTIFVPYYKLSSTFIICLFLCVQMQFQNKAKLESLNADFLQMQDFMVKKTEKNGKTAAEVKKTLNTKTRKGQKREEIDVEATADELSKLGSTSSS